MLTWLRRLWHLINRPRFERDLMREMADHREQMANPREFGDSHRLLEASRDVWGWNWLDDAVQDLKLGIRALLRSPSFTVSATLILTFGLGVNVTLYQLANVVVFSPPAVRAPETLARFHRWAPHNNNTGVPYPLTEFVKAHPSALAAVLAEAGSRVAWGPEAVEQIEVSFVSTNWFEELGYGPSIGRLFSDAVDAPRDAEPGAVLAHNFWQARLGGDPDVIGRTVYLDRRPVTVVGVAPRELPGLDFDTPDVFLPIAKREYFYPESTFLRAWNTGTVAMYGRLRTGISKAAVRESLRITMQAIAAERPNEVKPGEWLEPMMAEDNFRPPDEIIASWVVLSFLGLLTTLVLAVASANLGNLVLSRATGRTRELGVRIALGARRSRIVRQLLVETLPLGVLGAAGSLLFASMATKAIANLGLPSYLDLSIDWRSIATSAAFATLALAIVGVLPAWKVAQQELVAAIKDGGQQVSLRLDRTRVRRLMVVAQVAGSCLLLAIAGMLTRSLQRVLAGNLGFEYASVAVLEMPLGRYGVTGEAARAYWYSVKERVRANPEVVEAAIVTSPPLGGRRSETTYRNTMGLKTYSQEIDPDYFRLMEIPIVAGRVFAPGEADAVVISERLARAMYGSGAVLGQGFPLLAPTSTVVGIAADAHTIEVSATNAAELYRPLSLDDFSLVYLVARARADVIRLPPILREAAELDPRVIPTTRLMRDDFDHRMRAPRVASAISAGIGGITLVLACLGIFGVVSYSVVLRTKEIGIHIALGARRSAVVRLIVRHVLSPVTVGIALGLAAAIPAGFALSGEPFYVQRVDPIAYSIALGVFASAAAAAAAIPALRVLKHDPIRSLRHD
jgi:putative ABC transport system permease protein